jgi:hypothetical protein
MARIVLLSLLLACLWHTLAARPAAEAELAAAQIAPLIETDLPLLLEVRAGDLSSGLEFSLRKLLLEQGADLREYGTGDLAAAGDSLDPLLPDPLALALKNALLVDIGMDLEWETVETRNFLSYHSERKPIYSFEVRQILLPGNQLKKIDKVNIPAQTNSIESQRVRNLKWFEPVLATTALASIIYLLWTTE